MNKKKKHWFIVWIQAAAETRFPQRLTCDSACLTGAVLQRAAAIVA